MNYMCVLFYSQAKYNYLSPLYQVKLIGFRLSAKNMETLSYINK